MDINLSINYNVIVVSLRVGITIAGDNKVTNKTEATIGLLTTIVCVAGKELYDDKIMNNNRVGKICSGMSLKR